MVTRWPMGRSLAIGAVFAALGNFGFVWLAYQVPTEPMLYLATAADQFGNGMAGVRTLEELLKLTNELYDITVFGAEPHPNYNRILLSPVLAGEQGFDDIVLNDLDWYRHHGIDLRLGRRVIRIDRARRRVRCASPMPARSSARKRASCAPSARRCSWAPN